MEGHVCGQVFFVVVFDSSEHGVFEVGGGVPGKFVCEYLGGEIAVVDAGAVLEGLVVSVLGESAHIMEEADALGCDFVFWLVPFHGLGDCAAYLAHSDAVLFFKQEHRRQFSVCFEFVGVVLKPLADVFCGQHCVSPPFLKIIALLRRRYLRCIRQCMSNYYDAYVVLIV